MGGGAPLTVEIGTVGASRPGEMATQLHAVAYVSYASSAGHLTAEFESMPSYSSKCRGQLVVVSWNKLSEGRRCSTCPKSLSARRSVETMPNHSFTPFHKVGQACVWQRQRGETATYACGRLTLGSLPSLPFLRQRLSLNLKLTDAARRVGQQTLHIFLFLHSQRWTYTHILLCQIFT